MILLFYDLKNKLFQETNKNKVNKFIWYIKQGIAFILALHFTYSHVKLSCTNYIQYLY